MRGSHIGYIRSALCLIFSAFSCTLFASAQTNASCSYHLFQIPFSNGVALSQGINPYGTIVGYVNEYTGHSEGFIRYSNGGVSAYKAPNSTDTNIARRNAAGVDVGSYTPTGSALVKGFVATSSGFQSVMYPGASQTFVTAINKYGTIVGNYLDNSGHFHGFRLKSGTFSTIQPSSSALNTFVAGINDSGYIVGSYDPSSGDRHGFLLENGVYHTIDFPNEKGFGGTTLNDISNSNKIVGSIWTGSDTQSAFLYENGAFKVVSVASARLTQANGIGSTTNVIVGHAVLVSSGGQETDTAFTATCN